MTTAKPTATTPQSPDGFRFEDPPERQPDAMTSFNHLTITGSAHYLLEHFGNRETTLVAGEHYVGREPVRSTAGLHYPDLLVAFAVDPEVYYRRNEQFKLECLSSIARRADFQWGRLAEAAYERDNPTAHEIPNQYVRIMRWMHLSGEELLDMEEPLRELLKLLRDYDYASEGNLYINIPTASAIEKARADHGDDFSIDWWGLHYAETSNDYGIDGCSEYFPQLFSGRWTPRAQPPDETPTPSPGQQREIDALHADVQRVLNGSLYLPRP